MFEFNVSDQSSCEEHGTIEKYKIKNSCQLVIHNFTGHGRQLLKIPPYPHSQIWIPLGQEIYSM